MCHHTDDANHNGELMEFLRYFQDTYVGQRISGQVEIPGQFPYQHWNMYQRVKDDLPRTNNSLEGWHNAFAKNIPDHPSMPVLAAKYQREQHRLQINREHHITGRRFPQGRKKYQTITRRLKTLITQFDSGILVNLVYLEAIAKVMPINTDT